MSAECLNFIFFRTLGFGFMGRVSDEATQTRLLWKSPGLLFDRGSTAECSAVNWILAAVFIAFFPLLI